jgi:hypothetical protein
MVFPAQILGITGPNAVWKLQYGLPNASGIKEVSPAGLATFELVPYFAATVDGWVQVRVPVNAGTTSGSSYPRCELREMTASGGQAAWDSKTANRWYEYEISVTHLPLKKPQMCVLQLHDDSDDLLEVIYQKSSSGGWEFTQRVNGSSSGQPTISHTLGRPCVLALGIVKGVPTVYRDGVAIMSTTKMPQSSKTYAKLLNYLQSNTKTDKVGEYGEIMARNVRVGSGAYPGPQVSPSPVPTPDPTPVPVPPRPTKIQIIRHGEKPKGSTKGYDATGKEDPHSLTKQGWARAAALVGLFDPVGGVPKAGLSVPTIIYAADGPNAGERMVETATPLVAALNVPLVRAYDKGSESSLARALKTLPAGAQALVVWEHSRIPALVAALGASSPKPPKKWDSSRFDLVWTFTADGKGGWVFAQIPELVLPTDKPAPMKASLIAKVKQALGIGVR